jgi:hypothetical protein
LPTSVFRSQQRVAARRFPTRHLNGETSHEAHVI